MNYLQLQEYISRMTPEQLNCTVTVWFDDEFFPVDHAELTNDNEEDRLDDGHPILVVL